MAKASILSPIGAILLDCDGTRLVSIRILSDEADAPPGYHDAVAGSPAAEARDQLRAYFDEGFTDFDLPLTPPTTLRGAALRAAILAVPPGETLSYGAVARNIGSAPRAIGQACARNMFPIVIPCHRVVGSGGAIGHYSAGRGIETKSWLLNHERRGGLL